MYILPAIDLIGGKAVRLYKGEYDKVTVYSDHPEEKAAEFVQAGAEWIHIVDLEGAKSGKTPNIEIIKNIASGKLIKTEVGGGIRSMQVVEAYARAGAARMVLGTAAVTDPDFLKDAVKNFDAMIAVGVDIKDGYVAIHGWTERSAFTAQEFCLRMQDMGVRTVICTDVSRDGAMRGTNLELYRELQSSLSMDIIASGGVSDLEDVQMLKKTGVCGAIIGKALYTGDIDLAEAVRISKE